MKEPLKEKLKNQTQSIGSWLTLGHTGVVEIMANSGFDWLAVDMEHSAISLTVAQEMIRVIELSGCTPLVRVGENDANIIKRVMDAGAHGVIVPMVNSWEEAEAAVKAVYYPPNGKRGVGLARAQKYGFGFEDYKKWLQGKASVIVQIEHIDAVNHLEEILSVDGVDGSIVGPYDLSGSMGFPGEFDRDDVKAAIKKYKDVCQSLNKPAGFHVVPDQVDMLKEKMDQGFSFLGFSLDSIFLGSNARTKLKEAQA